MSRSAEALISLLNNLVPGDDIAARMEPLLTELQPLVANKRDEDQAGVYWGYRLALDFWREPVVDLEKYYAALEAAHLHFEVKEDAHFLVLDVSERLGFRPTKS